MICGKDWTSLIVVSVIALALITLMIVIQALQRERSRAEIIRGVALVWCAVGMTLVLAWLLEDHWGGALIDVQLSASPEVVTRSLSPTQIAVLSIMFAIVLGLYVTAILTVRKLTQPSNELNDHGQDDHLSSPPGETG